MKKKLSVAFLWHMHQPVYQDSYEGVFYMPWVRLHAVKDYLDMLYKMDKFPNLKLNFNLSPTVLSAFKKYADGYDDIHSILSVKAINELTNEDKLFILNYFFDANYSSMIMRYPAYNELYKKRNSLNEVNIEFFSDKEYSDIMFWFNMAWMDPVWLDYYPELKTLVEKGGNYSQEDRKYLIELQRSIIAQIIPAYKKYQDEGKIEVSTNPLYHPIMPLLVDINSAKNSVSKYALPDAEINLIEDAKAQVEQSLSMYEKLFAKKPKGMWLPEFAISNEVLDLFADYGIKWTVADESILAESIGKEFLRDVRGYLEDPYYLSKVYTYKSKNSVIDNSDNSGEIGVYFRNSVFANLINFEYPHNDSVQSAYDLYDRIKNIQSKLQISPDKNNIAVIALDGENSWENYSDDGNLFLETLYNLICEDKTLETVTLSDYYEKNDKSVKINNVVPGSWLNKNFQLWIAEPTKNKAWEYLIQVRNDLLQIEKNIDDELLKKALWGEIYVVEGSDWFWWFGEPNDSGQDNLFDYLFRRHLQNVYLLSNNPVPEFLKNPLTMILNSPSRYQKTEINPIISGFGDSKDWDNAGCIDIPSGPLTDSSQVLNKICYGVGNGKLYLKMDLNDYSYNKILKEGLFYQIYVYLKNRSLQNSAEGKLRLVMRPESLTPILRESFSHEIKFTFASDRDFPIEIAYSNEEGLWFSTLNNNVKCVLNEVLEIEIPLSDIGMKPYDVADFIVIDGFLGHGIGTYPRDMFLTVEMQELKVMK